MQILLIVHQWNNPQLCILCFTPITTAIFKKFLFEISFPSVTDSYFFVHKLWHIKFASFSIFISQYSINTIYRSIIFTSPEKFETSQPCGHCHQCCYLFWCKLFLLKFFQFFSSKNKMWNESKNWLAYLSWKILICLMKVKVIWHIDNTCQLKIMINRSLVTELALV